MTLSQLIRLWLKASAFEKSPTFFQQFFPLRRAEGLPRPHPAAAESSQTGAALDCHLAPSQAKAHLLLCEQCLCASLIHKLQRTYELHNKSVHSATTFCQASHSYNLSSAVEVVIIIRCCGTGSDAHVIWPIDDHTRAAATCSGVHVDGIELLPELVVLGKVRACN